MSTRASVRSAILLALGGVGSIPQDGSEELEKPVPVAVSVLEVRASSAASIDTRRLSYRFEFEVLRTIEDGAGVGGEGGLVRDGKIGFGCFQSADVQSGKDAASRTLELLDAKPGERDPAESVRRPYVLGDVGVIRLTILRRTPAAEDLWILERPDGRRVTIAYGRSRR